MYWISYEPLKTMLRERSLSDRAALPYNMVFSVSATLSATSGFESKPSILDALHVIVAIAITIIGIRYCYECNGGWTGFDFIQKSVVLGWIVAVRIFVFFVIPVLIIGLFAFGLTELTDENPVETTWPTIAADATVKIFYF